MNTQKRRAGRSAFALLSVFAVLFTVGLTGCFSRGSEPFAERPSASGDHLSKGLILVVQNHHWADMTIYALVGGSRIRLGRVGSLGEEDFDLPSSIELASQALVFVAIPLASRQSGVQSPQIVATPGEELVWTLHNNLSLSSLSRRR